MGVPKGVGVASRSERAGGRGRWLESVKGGRNDSLPFSSFGRLLFWRSGSKGPATDTRCHVGWASMDGWKMRIRASRSPLLLGIHLASDRG